MEAIFNSFKRNYGNADKEVVDGIYALLSQQPLGEVYYFKGATCTLPVYVAKADGLRFKQAHSLAYGIKVGEEAKKLIAQIKE